jgi:DNA-binding GntR family transcriptional regulator
VNILREDQGEVSMQFAKPDPDKFRGMSVSYGELDEPLLSDVLAQLECRVTEEVAGGTHSVFLAEVQSAHAKEGVPLTFYRGQMGRFEDAADEKVYGQIRQQVLTRELHLGEQIDADDLAERLDVPRQSIYYAMTKLSGEDLVSRESEGVYAINPLDADAFCEAMDAHCMIELGIVEQAVGNVSDEEVAGLREKAEATVPHIQGGHFVDFEAYMETNRQFHEYLVGLAKNDILLASYRRLGLATALLRTLHSYEAKDSMTRDHLDLVEAFEAADLEEAKRVIRHHTEESKRHGQNAIESAGGRI